MSSRAFAYRRCPFLPEVSAGRVRVEPTSSVSFGQVPLGLCAQLHKGEHPPDPPPLGADRVWQASAPVSPHGGPAGFFPGHPAAIADQIFTYLDVQGLTNQAVDRMAKRVLPPR